MKICDEVGGHVEQPRLVGRQRHRANTPAESIYEYVKLNVMIPFLDHLLSQLNSRFSADSRTCTDIFVLVPELIVKTSEEDLITACEKLKFWSADLLYPSSLLVELLDWQQKWKDTPQENRPADLVSCLQHADNDQFHNIHSLLAIGCTMPVSSAGAERSFSCLWRTKSYLRSRMSEDCLAGLCLMNIHRDIVIPPDVILQEFLKFRKRRMFTGYILYDD